MDVHQGGLIRRVPIVVVNLNSIRTWHSFGARRVWSEVCPHAQNIWVVIGCGVEMTREGCIFVHMLSLCIVDAPPSKRRLVQRLIYRAALQSNTSDCSTGMHVSEF